MSPLVGSSDRLDRVVASLLTIEGPFIINPHSSPPTFIATPSPERAEALLRSFHVPDGLDPSEADWLPFPQSHVFHDVQERLRLDQTTLLTYEEAAERLRIDRQTLKKLTKSGAIPVVVISERLHRIRLGALNEFILAGGVRFQS